MPKRRRLSQTRRNALMKAKMRRKRSVNGDNKGNPEQEDPFSRREDNSLKRPVIEMSDSSLCPVIEMSDSSLCPVKEMSDSSLCPVKEMSDSSLCPVKEMSDSSLCPVIEMSDSSLCPVKEMSDSSLCPVIEMSDSSLCPVIEMSDSSLCPVIEMSDSSLCPVIEMSDSSLCPVIEMSDSSLCPVIEMSDSSLCPVKEMSDSSLCPVIEMSDSSLCPVIEMSDSSLCPVIEMSDSSLCPVIEMSDSSLCPVKEMSDSSLCPVIEMSDSSLCPVKEMSDSSLCPSLKSNNSLNCPVSNISVNCPVKDIVGNDMKDIVNNDIKDTNQMTNTCPNNGLKDYNDLKDINTESVDIKNILQETKRNINTKIINAQINTESAPRDNVLKEQNISFDIDTMNKDACSTFATPLNATKITVSPNVFRSERVEICGSFHQGDAVRFGRNAGKQCVANSYAAIVSSKIKPVHEWNTEFLDSILVNGDQLYSHIHGNNDLLLVEDVPEMIEMFGTVVCCTKKDSINAILGEVDPNFAFGLPLDLALQNSLIDSDGCFISVNGFTCIAIQQNHNLYLFDSHSRDINGRSDPYGTSITIQLQTIDHLYDILRAFVNNNHNSLFEITGIEVSLLNQSHSSEVHINNDNEARNEFNDMFETIEHHENTCDVQVINSLHVSNTVEHNENTSDIEVIGSDTIYYDFKPLDSVTQKSLCKVLGIKSVHIKKTKRSNNIMCMGNPIETKSITGDGNCLFRAISFAATRRQEYFHILRTKIIEHLINNKEKFESFVEAPDRNVEDHIARRRMMDNNVWGTALEIIAAADLLKTDIYTFFNGKWVRYSSSQIDSNCQVNEQSIYLKHLSNEQHYEVVITVDSIQGYEKNFQYQSKKSKKEQMEYQTNPSLRLKKQEKQRDRYAENLTYRSAKKEKGTEKYWKDEQFRVAELKKLKDKYKNDDNYRADLKNSSITKYKTNEAFRKDAIQASKDKYKTNDAFRKDAIQASKDKYKTNEAFKKDAIQASKDKYKTNEAFKKDAIQASKDKYKTNETFRNDAIESSKLKYKKDEQHKAKIVEQTKGRRSLQKTENQQIEKAISNFKKKALHFPEFVCSCCLRLLFENQVLYCRKELYKTDLFDSCISQKYIHRCTETCETDCKILSSSRGSLWVCYTCHRKLQKGEMPAESFFNDLQLEDVPDELDCLNQLEQHLIALNIPFLKIVNLPKGKQQAVSGPVVSVPSDIKKVTQTLPRSIDDSLLVKVKLKRKLQYKGYAEYQFVDTKHVEMALTYLKHNNKWYSDIEISKDSLTQIVENEETDENIEVTTDNNQETETENQSKEEENESYLDDRLRGLQLDTCLQPPDIGQEALDCYFDQVYNLAPAEGNNPVSLLQEDGIEAKSFPCHYPSGKNTLNEERAKKLSLLRYFNLRLLSVDNRFAKDTSYIFFCQYMSELDRVMSNVQISLRKDFPAKFSLLNKINLCNKDTLTELFKKDEAIKFLKPVRGTPPYWQSAQKDMFAMIRQIGIPTFFCSFSSADFRWSEIIEAILKQQGDVRSSIELSWNDKCSVLRSNPITAARMFDQRFHLFLKEVILSDAEPLGHVLDYFYRVEFQQRGSPHTHSLFWIEGAPKFEEDDDETVTAFIDKYITCRMPDEESEPELHEIITTVQQHSKNHSKTCRKKGTTCRFNFPRPPSQQTFISRPINENETENESNECKKKLEDLWRIIQDSENEDFTTEVLFEKAGLTQQEFEKCFQYVTNRNTVVLKREKSETFINQYNASLIRAWNANIDIQFVLDAYSCIVYIISYISKAERELGLILQQTRNEAADGNLSARQTMKKIGTSYLHHREISAQEAAFRVTGLRLKESSRKTEFVPVGENPCRLSKPLSQLKKSNKKMQTTESQDDNEPENGSGEDVWLRSKTDCYKARPNNEMFEKMCMAEFCSDFNILATSQIPAKINEETTFQLQNEMGYIRKRTKTERAIIRYPRFSVESASEKYYRSILELYLPFRTEEQLKPVNFTSYEDFYNTGFVRYSHSKELDAVKLVVDLNMAQFVKSGSNVDEAVERFESVGPQEDAWAQLCPETENERLQCDAEGKTSNDATDQSNPQEDIPDLNRPDQSRVSTCLSIQTVSKQDIFPDLQKLNKKQRQVFYKVREWCLQKVNGQNPEAFHVFVTGGAGTGKSHLIRCLFYEATRLLAPYMSSPDDISVMLTAPTGTAAFNIGGMTIHSAFSIFKSLSIEHCTLSEDKLNSLRSKLENLQILIIDEISMVNKRLLYFVHERLRQIKKTTETCSFGGVSIIAVGDFYQLPPIKTKRSDKLYVNDPSNPLNSIWNGLFSVAILEEIMRQKDDEQFAELLNRLRVKQKNNSLSSSDFEMLRECMNEGPDHVLHIFATNVEIQDYNSLMIMKHCGEPKLLEAVDFEKERTTGRLMKRRSNFLKVDTQLPSSILLAVGARVMLIKNEKVDDGLVNGVMGTVMEIGSIGEDKLPTHVYIVFDNPKIGKDSKMKKVINGKNCVRIEPSFEEISQKNGKRKQFPLQLAFACTAHKVQGLTVSEVVVDLSKCFAYGQAYVALSRVTSKSGLHIVPLDHNSLQKKIYSDPDIQIGLEGMSQFLSDEVQQPEVGHIKILYHNIQGLHAHIRDLQNNPEMTRADYICLTETWLNPDANVDLHGYTLHQIARASLYGSEHAALNELRLMKGGGVGVYSKDSVEFEEIQVDNTNLECIAFRVPKAQIVVVTMYRTQKYPIALFKQNMQNLVLKLEKICNGIIVVGDFNQDLLKGEESIKNCMSSLGFTQMVNSPTTESYTLIDHVYAKEISDVDVTVLPTYYSHHEAILVNIK